MYSVVDISAGPRIQWWLVNECFNKFPVISTAGTRGSGRWMDGMNMTIDLSNVPDTYTPPHCLPCLLADRDEMMPLNYQRSVPILTAALTLSWGREIKKHNV